MRERPTRPTIALAGGGHAHLFTLLRTGELTRSGFDVILVDPSPFLYYSGMATGVISGSYGRDENRIDLRRLVERGGGCFVQARVHRVNPEARALILDDGTEVRYDAASFAAGSEARGGHGVVPVKPVSNLADVRDRLISSGGSRSVVIVGGGAAGCEVAANVAALTRSLGHEEEVTLIEAGPDLLPTSPKKARHLMLERLQDAGVEVMVGQKAEPRVGTVILQGGRRAEAGLILAATGVTPPDLFQRSRLATGGDGALWVNRHLQSPNDPRIFGGGDAVAFRGGRLPRFGVYAVRQGPVLHHNLQAIPGGKPLIPYKPQRYYLYILELGDGTGLAIYGPLTNRSRLALRIKHRIDRRFVARYC